MTALVTALYRYPVKGLRGHSVPVAKVERCGFAGDRRWMVVDLDRRFVTQREHPSMARLGVNHCANGLILRTAGMADLLVRFPGADARPADVIVWRSIVRALYADASAGAWLAKAIGIACDLVYLADPEARPVDAAYAAPDDRVSFADGFPVLLASTSSLDDLNERLPSPVPIHRFRPNLVISDSGAWAEDAWRRVRIESVVFRLPKPCARCIVTSVDQQMGERPEPHEPLHTLGKFRRGPGGVMFGQNMIPDTLGHIAVGDRVEVLETGVSRTVTT